MFIIRDYDYTSDINVSVLFTDGLYYNVTLEVGYVTEWTRFEIPLPASEIYSVWIGHTTSHYGNLHLLIDTVALVQDRFTPTSWDIALVDDISPHAVLGLEGGTVTVSYATYAEILTDYSGPAVLNITYGDDLQGVTYEVYHGGVVIATGDGSAEIPVWVTNGLNIFAVYFNATAATDDSLTIDLKTDGGNAIPIVCYGQAPGLVGVTSNFATPLGKATARLAWIRQVVPGELSLS